MKLPNGYGSVYKLSGNRRKPWVARKTTGWSDNGQPVYYFVGYYETKTEALSALGNFNLDPHYMEYIPLSAIYEKWSAQKYPVVSPITIAQHTRAWELLTLIHNEDINNLTLIKLQQTIDNIHKNEPTLKTVKKLLSQLFDYAVKYDYITPDKNRVKYLVINPNNPNKLTRKVFKY